MKRLLAAFAMVTLIAVQARAQDASNAKSEAVAVSLSVGLTAAGAGALFIPNNAARAVGVGLLFLGPSTGRWYAGEVGLSGFGYRLIAVSLVLAGAAATSEGDACDDLSPCDDSPNAAGLTLFAAGAGVWLTGTIVDVVLADRAVRRYNGKHALSVTPAPMGESGQGLVLGGRF
jgi:hypothetical protein